MKKIPMNGQPLKTVVGRRSGLGGEGQRKDVPKAQTTVIISRHLFTSARGSDSNTPT